MKRLLFYISPKKYYKYAIQIPPYILKKTDLKEGDELDIDVNECIIMIKKSKNLDLVKVKQNTN